MDSSRRGNAIRSLETVDSTNAYARRNLEQLVDGEVVTAEVQTEGHGRLGRRWLSFGSGNLTASLVLKPFSAAERAFELANMAQYASLAVSDAIDGYGPKTALKWPNDVLAGGAKIAGILSECVIQGDALLGCVVGFGVNLNAGSRELDAVDQDAVSLALLIGQTVDRDVFLAALLERFFQGYQAFLRGGFGAIRERYKAKSTFLGTRIAINSMTERYSGVARDVDRDGALVLLDDFGSEKHVCVGDIR
jgi:BirA family biotin operon repressor/biotin-[acetyl-CoA-carboxylase] ligase